MMDDDDADHHPPPFGHRQQQQQQPSMKQSSPFGAPGASIAFGTARTTTADSRSPVPGAAEPSDDGAKLDALKAKLAEKKRRLLEKQRRAGERGTTTPPRAPSWGDDDEDAAAPPPPQPSRQRELAARNAARFAPSSSVAAGPAPFSAAAPPPTSASQVTATEREDLSSAVALVGTCRSMCPDEELQRRQRESDIQLLEVPSPAIFPPNYALRDTAIKRFRRSAADYKLDVPEWVRPADVLERVCGYLEEWVMVRGYS
jgi:hypothetical protein